MTISAQCSSPTHFSPLTGILDTRSPAGIVDPANWRWLQNLTVTAQNKLCRSPGWEKLFSQDGYNNQDLHDQLLSLAVSYAHTDLSIDRNSITEHPHQACSSTPVTYPETLREPITFLFESISTSGLRKLLAGTRSRLYALNESRGNWKLLDYAKGGRYEAPCAKVRWYGAQITDTAILTNGVDPVQSWNFDQPAFGCDQRSTQDIADLAVIGLTKAAVVSAWKGVIFLGDVEMDGVRVNHRLVWSDKDDALSWDPAKPESIAGFQDLDYGERIMGMAPLGNNLMIHTTKGIWRVVPTGDDAVYAFDKVYSEPHSGQACIAYHNTLVSDGDNHYYLGTDALYVYNLFLPKPEPLEWMHRATNLIFEGADPIDSLACDNHVAGYNSEAQELWVSWQTKSQSCPGQTLRFNLKYRQSFYLDHGFTAFVNYTSDKRDSINDFLFKNCICNANELPSLVKEGSMPAATRTCTVTPSVIHTADRIEIEDGFTQEDYAKVESDENSLCDLLGDMTWDDLCVFCNADKKFVMASSADYALKQYGGVYYRERFLPAATGSVIYAQDSYSSIAIKGPLSYGVLNEDKEIESLTLEYDADETTDPLEVKLSIGTAAQAIDPSPKVQKSGCAIMWDLQTENKRYLECLESKAEFGKTSSEKHAEEDTVPSLDLSWPLWYSGRFLYFKLEVSDPGAGGFCWSRVTTYAKRSSNCFSG